MAVDVVLSLSESILGLLGSYRNAGIIRSAWAADKDLKKLERSLDTISLFIREGENRQSYSAPIRQRIKELRHVVYDIHELLDEATTDALRLELKQSGEVCNCLSYIKHKFVYPFSLSNKIQGITERLNEIRNNASHNLTVEMDLGENVDVAQSRDNRITYPLTSVNKFGNIKGRDGDKREILKRVVKINDFEDCYGISILPIVGIGGLGKTILAQLVYSDPTIDDEFDVKLWGCVSSPFQINSVLERLVECVDIAGEGSGSVRERLGNILKDNRYFMVLDDVWTRNEHEWNKLKEILQCSGAKGGVILVTTRDRVVATNVLGAEDHYDLKKLPLDLCMSVFLENAFSTKAEHEKYSHLVEIGEDIVKKCGGLPLAAKTLGSSLKGQRGEREWHRVAESNLWDMEQKEGGILPALKLSYNALDPELRSCLAYLSVFPKDDLLCAHSVIQMWIAQGLIKHDETKGDELEDVGRKYLEELVSRSLLEEQPISFHNQVVQCKMNGLVHDLAMDVMREELALVSFNRPPDSRFVRHLVWDVGAVLYESKELPRGQIHGAEQQVKTFRWSSWMEMASKMFIERIISTFKGLRVLDLQCSTLENVPESIGRLKHLRYLNLSFNGSIKKLPITICKLLNLQTLLLMGCHQLQELPRDLGWLINLRFLALTVQSRYLFPEGMMRLRNLPCLRTLYILNCNELISLFPDEGDEELLGKNEFLKRLHVLHVLNCPKLSCLLSKGLVYLTALKELRISECESLDWGVEFPAEHGTEPSGLQSLELFAISGVPKLVGLPGGLDAAASSLRYVCIGNCGTLAALPDWLKDCRSLLGLVLSNCPNLACTLLPEVLDRLPNLYIEGCPNLSLGRPEDNVEDWSPYISRSPYIKIQGVDDPLFWEDGIRK